MASPAPCSNAPELPVSANNVSTDGRPQSVASTIDFLMDVGLLKTTVRRGWHYQGLENTESVADHMYRMAIMALVAPKQEGVDANKCVSLAVVHDIAEALVGDITPHCGKTKEEKHILEENAIHTLCTKLGSGTGADAIKALWWEYEGGVTPEAKFVKDLDKVELQLQAMEYETSRHQKLDEFFTNTVGLLKTPVGVEWAAEVESRRPSLPDEAPLMRGLAVPDLAPIASHIDDLQIPGQQVV